LNPIVKQATRIFDFVFTLIITQLTDFYNAFDAINKQTPQTLTGSDLIIFRKIQNQRDCHSSIVPICDSPVDLLL